MPAINELDTYPSRLTKHKRETTKMLVIRSCIGRTIEVQPLQGVEKGRSNILQSQRTPRMLCTEAVKLHT